LSYIGIGTGKNVKGAMDKAISCPLLGDDDLQRAGKVIVNIGTIPETTHEEICDALEMLQRRIDKTTSLAFEIVMGSEARVGLIITALR
jgi:cell division GTPase FtsZ